MADELFDESMLTDVRDALESLYDISYYKYNGDTTYDYADPVIIKGNFISSSQEAFKKFNFKDPVAGIFMLSSLGLSEKAITISKKDKLSFFGNNYAIQSIDPSAFVVINGTMTPAVYNISVTTTSVK